MRASPVLDSNMGIDEKFAANAEGLLFGPILV